MQESIVVQIVDDQKPFSLVLVMQPVLQELKYVRITLPSTGDSHPVGILATTSLEAGCVAGVDPKYSRRWRSIANAMGVLDGEL